MKKLVNLRIPVLLACFLAFGTAIGYIFIYFSIDLAWIIATVPTVAVILIFVRKGVYVRVTIVLTAVIFIVGAVAAYIKIDNFGKSQINDNTYCSVCATVSDKGANARGEYVILTYVTANDAKIDGKMIAYLGEFYGDFCDIGYTVRFNATINKIKTFEYGKPNYFLADNVKYNCYVKSGVKAEEDFSLFGSIRIAIRDMLFENLDGDTAAIAYGMLTGNTQYIEEGALRNFRYGGIAHIFAVSGLHIGIVYGLFYILCKRLRLNRWATICLCLLPVFFYVGVCGFTLSPVRAAVMCTVSLFARRFHKKYDGLNSLALSVIIILLINPLNVLSVGFQLSVFAVGGILLLSSRLMCRFKKVPRKIAKPVGVALGAQAGTLPVMLTNFGYISGAGLLLNIVIVPILSIQFIVMFISTVIALILPFASSVIIPYSALPLEFIVSFFLDAGFENALIKGFGAGLFLPVYYIGLAILSDKINMKLLTRLIALGCTAVILVSYVLVKTFIPFSDFTVAVSAYYNGGEVLIKSHNGNVLIITENMSPAQTAKFLNNNYSPYLDAVILLGGENCAFDYPNLELDCGSVYVFFGYFPAQPFNNIQINYERQFTVCGVEFEFGDGYSVLASCSGVDIAVCAGGDIPFGRCDILISDIAENYCSCGYQVSFNERNVQNCVYDDGDFYFKIKDNEIG